jgi:putative SOS response-associated peptidase YedK
MCGRTRCTLTDADIVNAVIGGEAKEGADQKHPPRARLAWPGRSVYIPLHNAGPARVTPAVTAVRAGGGDGDDDNSPPTIAVESMVWGVPRGGGGASPSGAPPPSAVLVNGRAETAFSTPTWARSLAAGPAGRAVVIANGYYEWKRGGGGGGGGGSAAPAQPHYVFRADGAPLALAALVTPAPAADAAESDATARHPPLRRYAVLTTAPPRALAWLHDRAPLLLPTPTAVAAWLDPARPPTPASLDALACPAAVEAWPALAAHPVKREVGSVKYQAADCSVDVRSRKGSLGALFAAHSQAAAAGGGGAGGGGGGAAGSPPPALKRVKKEEGGGGGGGAGTPVKKTQKRTLDGFLKRG